MTTQAVAKKEKKKAVIEINAWCTGCTICVDICPADVLNMVDDSSVVAGQRAYVKNLEACTQCMMCEIHCPDFAITVK